MGLWIHWFRDLEATIPNGSFTTGWMSLVGVGYSGLDLIVPLMLHTICCVITGDKRRMLHIQAPLLAYVNSLALLFV
jgi:hypothetical protein